MSDFFPQYNASTKLAGHSETVPFRLTRNLHTFFTIFGVEGIYITAMTLAAVAALQPHSNVLDFLHLLFR